jgi:hypothetical protein
MMKLSSKLIASMCYGWIDLDIDRHINCNRLINL